MILKSLDSISEHDLLSLVENQVFEQKPLNIRKTFLAIRIKIKKNFSLILARLQIQVVEILFMVFERKMGYPLI